MLKLFHAGLLSPAILKSMLSVTPLREALNVLPSGGVTPSNACEWWDAGAAAVGMGGNLTGGDLSHPHGSEQFVQLRSQWESEGREAAARLLVAAQERARLLGESAT